MPHGSIQGISRVSGTVEKFTADVQERVYTCGNGIGLTLESARLFVQGCTAVLQSPVRHITEAPCMCCGWHCCNTNTRLSVQSINRCSAKVKVLCRKQKRRGYFSTINPASSAGMSPTILGVSYFTR